MRLYEMAIQALGQDAAATTRLRCELLLALADAQGRAGDGLGAKSTFLRAADLARSARLPEMLARGAVGYGGRFLWAHALTDERLVPLLEDGLSALGEGDSVLRVQLLSRLAAALRHGPSPPSVASGYPRRPSRARAGSATTQRSPMRSPPRSAPCTHPTTPTGGWPRGRRSSHSWRGPETRSGCSTGHEHSFWAAWELGDPDRPAIELASMTRVTEELRQPAQLWILATAQATLALSQGPFVEAGELIERAAAMGERVLAWYAAAARKMQLFLLRREQGRLDGFVREVRDHGRRVSSPLVHRAFSLTSTPAWSAPKRRRPSSTSSRAATCRTGTSTRNGSSASACSRRPAQSLETPGPPLPSTSSSCPTARSTLSPSPSSRSAPPASRSASSRPCWAASRTRRDTSRRRCE